MLSEEKYYLEFQRFLLENDESEIEINKECDCKSENECDCKKENIKTETLTKKEKKKKERDKESLSRKKSWGVDSITQKKNHPDGYKELQSLSRGITEKKQSKNKKKQCIKGNPFHSGNDGRFVNPYKEKGSWSIGKGDTSGKDCDWGQASRKSANRSQQWVKRDCGRNAKYRCRDGSKKWEESKDLVDSDSVSLDSILTDELFDELKRRLLNPDVIKEKNKCFINDLNKALEFCAAISSADKGIWPPKKK